MSIVLFYSCVEKILTRHSLFGNCRWPSTVPPVIAGKHQYSVPATAQVIPLCPNPQLHGKKIISNTIYASDATHYFIIGTDATVSNSQINSYLFQLRY